MPALILLIIRLGRALWSGMKDPEFRGLFTLTVLVILTGAWFYHTQEGWNWLDSFYFTVITLTTVGYGDFSPTTPAGKIFTMVYIFLGLGIISGLVLLVAERQRKNRPSMLSRFRSGGTEDSETGET